MPRKILLLLALVLLAPLAHALDAPSEASCRAGNAEACFYAGAEYAQGQGVAEDKRKAVGFFLEACDGGIPDGCSTSGILIAFGEGNLEKDVAKGVELMERACGMGHFDGCSRAVGHRTDAGSPAFDPARGVGTARAGCVAGVKEPCYWGLDLAWDGKEGKFPAVVDMASAGWFAEEVCNRFHEQRGCSIAARVYADPEAPTFDAVKGLTYSMIRCDEQGSGPDCRNVAGVYLDIEEYEIGATYLRRACDQGHEESCGRATEWETYNREMAEYEAWMAAHVQEVDAALAQGRYGDAVGAAINGAGSRELVQKAILAARAAGRMGDIGTNNLYAAALWFPSGPVRAAADAELAARGTGLEGRFGTGTNSPGMADARWKQVYGTSAPTYRSSPSQSMPARMESAAEISEATRKKYRYAHCVMKGSNTSAQVCQ